MTELYLDQLRSCKVKSLLCHAAYHDAATTLDGWLEVPFEVTEGFELLFELIEGVLSGATRLQLGAARISWASRKA